MQYAPFASDIELPFYTALASHKINHDKLDDSARPVLGLYEIRSTDPENASCRIQIHGNSLACHEAPAGHYRAEGMIKNVNTIEEYRNMDKSRMITQAGRTIWDAINDGTIYSCPSLLSSFVILSFADLKKYKFSYWFAFPALHSDPPWIPARAPSDTSQSNNNNSSNPQETSTLQSQSLSPDESTSLVESVQTWSYGIDDRQRGFFLARKQKSQSNNSTQIWQVASLSEYEEGFFNGAALENRYVCFVDPSNYEKAPGWMLRNLLVLVRQRWGLKKVQILRYRDTQARRDQGRSMTFWLESSEATEGTNSEKQSQSQSQSQLPKITGWERNPAGKLSGRTVNLTEYMDPTRLADQSVDLNLKLMKWRISPTLNLEKIKNTKCLLLGAGTLGSYVARNLLGWGVKKITFVDQGSVSFSNPVRQPLFNFEDCLNGGAPKAIRASKALTEIYPGVDSTGHTLSVPMAGHPIIDESSIRADFEKLKSLIDEHDAIFLLMDTRESRWLPTVMGKASRKIVMNAALGFDSFVVMRHGVADSATDHAPADSEGRADLGCYFCNDVMAPANSVKDQTLDQQCTVTRPGVAAIASALLVELLVSVLQHPKEAGAAAPLKRDEDRGDHPLGLVPHQIRGFLSTFENISVTGRSYISCSACSERVTNTYQDQGWDFVRRALNESGYVEELSGLKEVHEKAEAALANVEWDEASDNEEAELL